MKVEVTKEYEDGAAEVQVDLSNEEMELLIQSALMQGIFEGMKASDYIKNAAEVLHDILFDEEVSLPKELYVRAVKAHQALVSDDVSDQKIPE